MANIFVLNLAPPFDLVTAPPPPGRTIQDWLAAWYATDSGNDGRGTLYYRVDAYRFDPNKPFPPHPELLLAAGGGSLPEHVGLVPFADGSSVLFALLRQDGKLRYERFVYPISGQNGLGVTIDSEGNVI